MDLFGNMLLKNLLFSRKKCKLVQKQGMNNYITQGTTITVQTAILKEMLEDDKHILNYEKERMKRTLIDRIEELNVDEIVQEEDRANCKYLTIRTKFE